jgi:hypothetical protein
MPFATFRKDAKVIRGLLERLLEEPYQETLKMMVLEPRIKF